MVGKIGGGRYCAVHGVYLPNPHMDVCPKCKEEWRKAVGTRTPIWIKEEKDG